MTSGFRSATRVPELDGVRGIAIAAVMALHFVGALTPTNVVEQAAVKLSGYGIWGVDLFFVLSGFLITGILADTKSTPSYFRNFYVRRTLRIFPLYYAVLFLMFLVIPRTSLGAADPSLLEARRLQGWIWSYLTNIYLGQGTTFSIPYVSHFWSLSIEEHFYLFWPFVVWRLSRDGAMRACLWLGGIAVGLRIAFLWTAPELLHPQTLTFCRLDALCAGGWCALWVRGGGDAPVRLAIRALKWTAGTLVLLSLWHTVTPVAEFAIVPLRTTAGVVMFAFAMVVICSPTLPRIASTLLGSRILTLLGKYSYGLYVYHGIVAYALHHGLANKLYGALGITAFGAVAEAALGALVSVVLAVLSYELFEVKFLALKRHFEADVTARRSAQPRPEGADSVAAKGALQAVGAE